MATSDALNAVCNSIVHILRSSMSEQAAELNLTSINPRFEVYQPDDFGNSASERHINSGASVFLYRALPNLSHRTPSDNLRADGRQQFNKLPLDLGSPYKLIGLNLCSTFNHASQISYYIFQVI